MKSNSRASLVAAGVAALGIFVISRERAPLAEQFHRLTLGRDAYYLPDPEQAVVTCLGYRSAAADLIWGHLLVAYGMHFREKRLFAFVGEYFDTINALDPAFREPYRYADTLLTLQPVAPPPEFYRKAQAIFERGMRSFPNDQELWLTAGQYLAYIAPQRTENPEEQRAYREAGTRALMRACELIGSNENMPFNCLPASILLSSAGSRDAARRFLERVLVVSDDPEIQERAAGYLNRTLGAEAQSGMQLRLTRFRAAWGADLPFIKRDAMLALGPRFDAAHCAGSEPSGTAECITSWRAWAALQEQAPAP